MCVRHERSRINHTPEILSKEIRFCPTKRQATRLHSNTWITCPALVLNGATGGAFSHESKAKADVVRRASKVQEKKNEVLDDDRFTKTVIMLDGDEKKTNIKATDRHPDESWPARSPDYRSQGPFTRRRRRMAHGTASSGYVRRELFRCFPGPKRGFQGPRRKNVSSTWPSKSSLKS